LKIVFVNDGQNIFVSVGLIVTVTEISLSGYYQLCQLLGVVQSLTPDTVKKPDICIYYQCTWLL